MDQVRAGFRRQRDRLKVFPLCSATAVTKTWPGLAPALALSADSGAVTAIASDYRYEDVFARQVQALGSPGDILLAFSTSGQSPNVISAVQAARSRAMAVIARPATAAAAWRRPPTRP